MNRYDHHFRTLAAHLRSTPVQRVGFASGALFEHRANGFGWQDDDAIVRQFDLSGMDEFWEIELSEPMTCDDFIRSLAKHFYKIEWRPGLTEDEYKKLGPIAEQVNESVKVGIRQALRAARSYGEPWFMAMTEPPPNSKLNYKAWIELVLSDTVIIAPDPPVDGIDLNKLRVQPRAAVEWMLSTAQRRHLVPPSLAALLRPSQQPPPLPSTVISPPPRRRGPKPTKLAAVAAAIRTALSLGKHTLETLDGATEESLVAEFRASRETCRKARGLVMSEFVGDSVPGK